MPDEDAAKIALLAYRLDRAEAEIREMQAEMELRKSLENKRLLAGIVTLAGTVGSLVFLIIKYIPSALKG
ncbi:MAG: hypothetical protein DI556_09890 [Rhodovulum sulfidophilum]|uniref:Uncharacterized protein n=1 Tax=Rhodovulum sulfidophilum TaxID=35806 RepID=A0A2W5N8H6_RHOSU|nr:MAG: hypothetical protein DI556_09890 [Rhodovulum sulfidophilum]